MQRKRLTVTAVSIYIVSSILTNVVIAEGSVDERQEQCNTPADCPKDYFCGQSTSVEKSHKICVLCASVCTHHAKAHLSSNCLHLCPDFNITRALAVNPSLYSPTTMPPQSSTDAAVLNSPKNIPPVDQPTDQETPNSHLTYISIGMTSFAAVIVLLFIVVITISIVAIVLMCRSKSVRTYDSARQRNMSTTHQQTTTQLEPEEIPLVPSNTEGYQNGTAHVYHEIPSNYSDSRSRRASGEENAIPEDGDTPSDTTEGDERVTEGFFEEQPAGSSLKAEPAPNQNVHAPVVQSYDNNSSDEDPGFDLRVDPPIRNRQVDRSLSIYPHSVVGLYNHYATRDTAYRADYVYRIYCLAKRLLGRDNRGNRGDNHAEGTGAHPIQVEHGMGRPGQYNSCEQRDVIPEQPRSQLVGANWQANPGTQMSVDNAALVREETNNVDRSSISDIQHSSDSDSNGNGI